MSSTHHALLIFGSGPGIGRNVAVLFAERGFRKVILMSRNKQRLAEDADLVRSARAGVDVQGITVDAADTDSARQALEKADEALGATPLEFVLFNTARTGPSKFFDFSAEELEADLRVCCIDWLLLVHHIVTHGVDFRCQPVHGRQMGNAKAPRPGKLQHRHYAFIRDDQWHASERSIPCHVLSRHLQGRTVQPCSCPTQGI